MSSISQRKTNGFGFHSMWGFSPCCDLLEDCHYSSSTTIKEEDDDVTNILLLQPCDPRHILPLLLRSQSEQQRKVHVYIYEEQVEVLARSIFLLYIFLDTNIPIRHCAALFLETFGNSLLSSKAQTYITNISRCLQIWTMEHDVKEEKSGNHDHPLYDMIDWTHLKQKERDAIDGTFNFWQNRSTKNSMKHESFDVKELRDYRLRGYYGQRYDWYVTTNLSMTLNLFCL